MLKIEGFQRRRVELNLSPLIDVIFILVIFIVLVARFIEQNHRKGLVTHLRSENSLRFAGAARCESAGASGKGIFAHIDAEKPVF